MHIFDIFKTEHLQNIKLSGQYSGTRERAEYFCPRKVQHGGKHMYLSRWVTSVSNINLRRNCIRKLHFFEQQFANTILLTINFQVSVSSTVCVLRTRYPSGGSPFFHPEIEFCITLPHIVPHYDEKSSKGYARALT